MPSQRGGLSVNRKPKEPVKREPDLESTSSARRYLRAVEKRGTPEQLAEAQEKVSALHPDMLVERRS